MHTYTSEFFIKKHKINPKSSLLLESAENNIKLGKLSQAFLDVLAPHVAPNYLCHMQNKLSGLKIYQMGDYEKEIVGNYVKALFLDRPRIILYKDNLNNKIIAHEMFHVVSSYHNFFDNRSGLAQINYRKKDFGRGLNEGVTEMLAQKYFHDETSLVYLLEMKVALELTKILGEEKILDCYLKGDLKSFLVSFDEYNCTYEVIMIIKLLDKVTSVLNNPSKYESLVNKVYEYLEVIYLQYLTVEKYKEKTSINVNHLMEEFTDNNEEVKKHIKKIK